MAYNDLQNMDYATLAYTSLLINLVLYQQTPVNAILFDVDNTHQCIIFIKRTSNGKKCTKRITAHKDKIASILSYIQRDFPYLPIEYK